MSKRAPELNPMDSLWGQGEDAICANTHYASIDELVAHFIDYLAGLLNERGDATLWNPV